MDNTLFSGPVLLTVYIGQCLTFRPYPLTVSIGQCLSLCPVLDSYETTHLESSPPDILYAGEPRQAILTPGGTHNPWWQFYNCKGQSPRHSQSPQIISSVQITTGLVGGYGAELSKDRLPF